MSRIESNEAHGSILINVSKCSAKAMRKTSPGFLRLEFNLALVSLLRLDLTLLFLSLRGEESRGHFMTFILHISRHK